MTKVLDKWAIYDHPLIAWEPHEGQLRVAEDNSRHQVVAGGRRVGKSRGGAMKIVPEIFYTKPLANQLLSEGKRREFWIVGPEYSDAEKEFRVIWNLCKKLQIPLERGSFNNLENGDLHIVLWDGTFKLSGKSARYPDQLVGEGLSGVVLAEAAKLKATIWPKYIRPALSDFDGWSFHSSTPEGKNWFYELFCKAKDPDNENWFSIRLPAWLNHYVYKTPTVYEHVYRLIELSRQTSESVFRLAKRHNFTIDAEILDELNELTPEAFLQEIAADFTEFVGRVFKEFDDEKHVTDLTFNPAWQTYAAVDYGYTNPNVWLLIQVGPWGEINVLDEVFESGLDPTQFADAIKLRGLAPPNMTCFFPDPADPGSTRILESRLKIRARGNTGGELQQRIRAIRNALRDTRITISEYWQPDDLEPNSSRPRLLFDRKCKKTIQNFLDYRYPETRSETTAKENPLKKDDHGPEALGRFFAGTEGLWGHDRRAKIHDVTYRQESEQLSIWPPRHDELATWK